MWWNENFLNAFGYPASQTAIGKESWTSRIRPGDQPEVVDSFNAVINGGGRLWSSEYRFRRNDGSYAFVFDRGYVLRDEQGRAVRVIGAMQDVTDRKQAEAELAHQRHLLETLMDRSPDHIYFKVLQSRFLACSGFLATALGLESRAEAVGKCDNDYFPEDYARGTLEDEQEIIRTGQPLLGKIEKGDWTGDGGITWNLTSKMPLRNPAGEIIGTFGISKDITEQKQKEEELRRTQAFLNSVVEHLPLGVFIKDAKDLRFVLWSKGNEELIGISRAEIIGKTDHDLFSEEEADRFTTQDRRTLERGDLQASEETVHTRHHGGRTLLTRKVPIMDENGRPTYLLGISEDITERKQAEAELEEAQKQLVDASHQAGMAEVATSVLHNVGNVLNSVNVSCSVISEKVRKSRVSSVANIAKLVQEHRGDLPAFFAANATGQKLPHFLDRLAVRLSEEQTAIVGELQSLSENIEHIKDIVAVQQSYAKNCLAAGMDDYISKPLDKAALLAVLARARGGSDGAAGKVTPEADQPRSLAIFPRERLLDQLEGDEALLQQMVTLFQDNTPQLLDAIDAAIARRHGGDLASSAHALLSSLGVFGATDAHHLTLRLGELGGASDFPAAGTMFATLLNEMGDIQKAVSEFVLSGARNEAPTAANAGTFTA